MTTLLSAKRSALAATRLFFLFLAVLVSPVSNVWANNITYTINNYADAQNGVTFSGTVTTNGTIGAISSLVDYDLTFTPPTGAPFNINRSLPYDWYTVSGLYASATDLYFVHPGPGVYPQFAVNASYLTNRPGLSINYYGYTTMAQNGYDSADCEPSLTDPTGQQLIYQTRYAFPSDFTGDGSFVIAEVATSSRARSAYASGLGAAGSWGSLPAAAWGEGLTTANSG